MTQKFLLSFALLATAAAAQAQTPPSATPAAPAAALASSPAKKELAARISPHGTFNFLLSNGQALWAHATTSLYYLERRHPFGEAHLSDEDLKLDFSQETSEKDEVSVVVTSPLTRNEAWKAFGKRELVVFSEGRRLEV